jgi:queuosine precursor transporter
MNELQSKRTVAMLWLISAHTSLLLASNAGGAKMIAVPGGLAASATVFSYAVTFPLADLINELGGPRAARISVNIGFVSLVVLVSFLQLCILAPPAAFWHDQEAFQKTLGFGWRILAGGWLSYLVGNHLDVMIFHAIRKRTGEKWFWLRKNASTAISQLVDTVIFMSVAFGGVFPIAKAIPGQYLLKFAVAVVCTPLSYILLKFVRRVFVENPASVNTSPTS